MLHETESEDTDGPVLVLDSDGRSTLCVVRSLGRKGVSVVAGGDSALQPAMLSKYATDSYVHPDQQSTPENFVADLEAHLRDSDYLAVIPTTDKTTSLLSREKDRLEETGTIVATETWERHRLANNKKELFELLDDRAVPKPRTYAPDSVDDLRSVAESVTYPALIKPQQSTVWSDDGHHDVRTAEENWVDSEAELLEAYQTILDANQYLVEADQYPLVQEVIDGVPTCTCGIAEDGELLTEFQHTRDRVVTSTGESGAVNRGLREPDMLPYARRVIDELGWTGPIHLDFLKGRDGEFYFLEVNGRYWHSTQLAVKSGVDVPWLHYLQLNGLDCRRPSTYRSGLRDQKLYYDFLWMKEQLAAGNKRAVPEVLKRTLSPTDSSPYLDLTDPRPLVGGLAQFAKL